MKSISPYLALFASLSTLFCCALPALFVALGLGATLASLISAVPQLVWFSEHKLLVFGSAGILLFIAGISQWQTRSRACPVDQSETACANTRRAARWILLLSFLAYGVGSFFAFVAPLLFAE